MSSIALVITFQRREKNEKHNLRMRFFLVLISKSCQGVCVYKQKLSIEYLLSRLESDVSPSGFFSNENI